MTIDLSLLRAELVARSWRQRDDLLPALHAAQTLYAHIPPQASDEIARALGVPLADVQGVIEFYDLFSETPRAAKVVQVCADPACAMRGADEVLAAAKAIGQTENVTVLRAPCLGKCNCGVAVSVTAGLPAQTRVFASVTASSTAEAIHQQASESEDFVGGDVRLMTALCQENRRAKLAEYEAAGGMRAWRKAMTERNPSALIAEVKAAGLVGSGGAAFPTGVKWEGAAKARGDEKYFVVNADESEPGTFKDRVLLERDPCRVLEGAMLGAVAIGAKKIFVYVRGEYPAAIRAIQEAIREIKLAGYLAEAGLEMELRVGAGAYVCGEETALFEAIEGKRGMPRFKPPFPVEVGVFGKPTAINNVETLAKVPHLLADGAAAFRRFGTEKSAGTKLFCLSGDVARPGVYEVPFGVTLRHVVDDLAGGVTGGGLKAILMGGAAGAFAKPDALDVKLSFEDLRAAGLPLGSGAILILNETRDVRDVLARLGHFFAHESCGKCYPCQLGTQRQHEILDRVAQGRALPGDLERLQDVGWTMTDASLCGLGQTAASAVLSALKLWPELFNRQG